MWVRCCFANLVKWYLTTAFHKIHSPVGWDDLKRSFQMTFGNNKNDSFKHLVVQVHLTGESIQTVGIALNLKSSQKLSDIGQVRLAFTSAQ